MPSSSLTKFFSDYKSQNMAIVNKRTSITVYSVYFIIVIYIYIYTYNALII